MRRGLLVIIGALLGCDRPIAESAERKAAFENEVKAAELLHRRYGFYPRETKCRLSGGEWTCDVTVNVEMYCNSEGCRLSPLGLPRTCTEKPEEPTR